MASTATVTLRPSAMRMAMLPAARSICAISQPPKMSPDGLVSAGMAITRIIALFNLKPGVKVADYEAWARAVDLPVVRRPFAAGVN